MLQPAKVLLLYAHPESHDSVANRVLLKPAQQMDNVTVHDLYAHYPTSLSIFIMSSSCCVNTRSLFSNILYTLTAARRC
ncbi:glutathione-regulated potassium-efflux system ancillary protein KefG [Serratia rubidaea]|uniref:Glutathione-regulated potassium-efflux system ancillary protein KefG n=1 Tax=Serratia rubidaea TaxID=61652 RepID=A0A447QKQ8_SERRU|nr:glutathione-regulated potassium-efflux system ancillary protein KefG [Serratia rubidaea]